MPVPLKVTFRNFSSSEAVEDAVRERVAKLAQLFSRIRHCDVMLEAPHRHRRRGNSFHVRIELGVPGKELVVARESADEAHSDIYVAIRDAFEAAGRQLEHYVAGLSGHRHARA
jgi:ribosomal subunit interface protein